MAGKIFTLVEPMGLDLIASKLKGYRRIYPVETTGGTVELVEEVRDLEFGEDRLEGIFSQEYLLTRRYRGEVSQIPVTRDTTIVFVEREGRVILLVVDKKNVANNIANKLSSIIFIEVGGIVEGRISHETLKAFHESNPEATRVIFFDDVDLPNVNKLSLYGIGLANTSLYNEYLRHGRIWYVVFEAMPQGYIIGLTRNCVITIFTRVDEPDFIEYTLEEILPLMD